MGSYLPLKIGSTLYPVKVGGFTGKNEPKVALTQHQLAKLKRAVKNNDTTVLRELEQVVDKTAVQDIRSAYMAWIPRAIVKATGLTTDIKKLTFVLPSKTIIVPVKSASKWLTSKTKGRAKPIAVWFGDPDGEKLHPFKPLMNAQLRAGLYEGLKLLDQFTLKREPKKSGTVTYYRKAKNAAKPSVVIPGITSTKALPVFVVLFHKDEKIGRGFFYNTQNKYPILMDGNYLQIRDKKILRDAGIKIISGQRARIILGGFSHPDEQKKYKGYEEVSRKIFDEISGSRNAAKPSVAEVNAILNYVRSHGEMAANKKFGKSKVQFARFVEWQTVYPNARKRNKMSAMEEIKNKLYLFIHARANKQLNQGTTIGVANSAIFSFFKRQSYTEGEIIAGLKELEIEGRLSHYFRTIAGRVHGFYYPSAMHTFIIPTQILRNQAMIMGAQINPLKRWIVAEITPDSKKKLAGTFSTEKEAKDVIDQLYAGKPNVRAIQWGVFQRIKIGKANESLAPVKGSKRVTRKITPRDTTVFGRSGELNLPYPERRTGRKKPQAKKRISPKTRAIITRVEAHKGKSRTGKETDVKAHPRQTGKAKKFKTI
jgi:hypothetical protein